jgi:hypothetical protein
LNSAKLYACHTTLRQSDTGRSQAGLLVLIVRAYAGAPNCVDDPAGGTCGLSRRAAVFGPAAGAHSSRTTHCRQRSAAAVTAAGESDKGQQWVALQPQRKRRGGNAAGVVKNGSDQVGLAMPQRKRRGQTAAGPTRSAARPGSACLNEAAAVTAAGGRGMCSGTTCAACLNESAAAVTAAGTSTSSSLVSRCELPQRKRRGRDRSGAEAFLKVGHLPGHALTKAPQPTTGMIACLPVSARSRRLNEGAAAVTTAGSLRPSGAGRR